jgi:accessory gene regulator protein AgrB
MSWGILCIWLSFLFEQIGHYIALNIPILTNVTAWLKQFIIVWVMDNKEFRGLRKKF